MKTLRNYRSLRMCVASFALLSGVAHAATLYWDGGAVDIGTDGDGASQGGAGTWNTNTLNWDQGGVLPHVSWTNSNFDSAVFGAAGGKVTLGAGVTVGGLAFDVGGYEITNSTLTFGAAGSITVTNGQAILASVLAGTVAITKDGAGKLVLRGTSTRTGATHIASGSVRLENAAGFGGANSPITINNGASLEVGTATTIASGAAVITLNDGGTIVAETAGAAGRIEKTISVEATATAVVSIASGGNAANILTINAAASNRLVGGATGARVQIKGSGEVNVGEAGQTRTSTLIADWYLQGGKLRIRGDGELGDAANDLYFEGAALVTDGAFTLGASRVLDFSHVSGGTVDTTGGNLTLASAGQLTGSNTLTKIGPNSLIITEANTGFSGDINLTGGTLLVNTPGVLETKSDVTVAAGTTLSGDGVINGTVQVAAYGNLSAGASAGAIGTLTLANNSTNALTLNGANLTVDLPATGTNGDLVAITGNLILNGANTLFINAPDGAEVGTYTVMSYAALSGTGTIVLANGSTTLGNVTLAVDTGTVTLTIGAGGYSNSIWRGDTDSVWDTSTGNWRKNGNVGQMYADGDHVTFDNTALAGRYIVTGGSVEPASVSVNGPSNYTISNQITGAGTPLIKSGSGQLILTANNSFGGGTIINGGTVSEVKINSLGSGPITVAGNSSMNPVYGVYPEIDNAVAVNSGVTLTGPRSTQYYSLGFKGVVSGDGTITFGDNNNGNSGYKLGLLNSSNTFTGTIEGGGSQENVVRVNSLPDSPNPIRLSNAGIALNSGTVTPLVFNSRQIVMYGSAGAAVRNDNASAANTITINTDLRVIAAGNKTFTLGGNNAGTNRFAGNITNGVGSTISVAKSGSGNWYITGNMSQTGGVTAQGGTGSLYISGTNTYSGATSLGVGGGGFAITFQNAGQSLPPTTAIDIPINNNQVNTVKLLSDTGGATGTLNLGNTLKAGLGGSSGSATMAVFVGNNGAANGGNGAGGVTGSTIILGTLDLRSSAEGGIADGRMVQRVGVTGANGYKLQLGDVIMPGRGTGGSNGGFFNPTTAPLIITGTVKQNNGRTAADNISLQTLVLDGSATGNVISGAIKNATDFDNLSNTNALATRLTKQNTSIWSLSGTNFYTGSTYVNGGTLIVNTLANGGVASSLGSSTNAVGLVLGGGTLQYAPINGVGGTGTSIDRNFTVTSGATLDASGTGALVFNQTGIISPDVTGLGGEWAAASAVVSNLTTTADLAIGMRVSGTGIPAGRTIASIDSATRITLNSGTSVTAGSGDVAFGYTARTLALSGTNTGNNTIAGILQDSSAAGAQALSLTKRGAGTWVLSGTNTYSGSTVVTGGTLLVNGSLAPASAVTVVSGTLGGNGVIGGNVSNRATVAPGASAGTLTVSGDYVQTTNGALNIEIGGTTPGTQHDVLVVSNTATLNGTLNVTLTNSYAGVNGHSFTILSATTVSGAFATTNLPVLGGGNEWNVEYQSSAVVLSITNAGGPPPPTGYNAFSNLNVLVQGPEGDDDGDGFANLYEYVTGSNPTNSGSGNALSALRTNGFFALKFLRDTNSVDATLIVEGSYASTNDAEWIGFATNLAGSWGSATNVIEGAGNPTSVTAFDVIPAATNRFLRLRITRP